MIGVAMIGTGGMTGDMIETGGMTEVATIGIEGMTGAMIEIGEMTGVDMTETGEMTVDMIERGGMTGAMTGKGGMTKMRERMTEGIGGTTKKGVTIGLLMIGIAETTENLHLQKMRKKEPQMKKYEEAKPPVVVAKNKYAFLSEEDDEGSEGDGDR